ncbi:hypothetical protein FGB62_304g01 [Gracilaria domingensis]|nr:hypothetical protein FGB62_304g01 [Gracilaria domingensis]
MECVFSAADAARVGASCRGGGSGGGVRVIRRHGSGWRGAADLRRKARAAAARRQLVVRGAPRETAFNCGCCMFYSQSLT